MSNLVGFKGRCTAAVGTAVSLLVLAACSGGSEASGASDEPLRIGVVTSQTGTYASLGSQVINAVKFAAAKANANGGVDGHKVEVTVLDAGDSAQKAVQQTKKAIQQESSPFIIGTISSAQSLAIAAQIERLDGLLMVTISKTDELSGSACNSRVFRSDHPDSFDAATFGPWLDKHQNVKTWSFIGADYAWGHDGEKVFAKVANEKGMKVDKTLFPPLGTTDYGAYISKLAKDQSDGLMVYLAGSDSNNFIKQARDFGLLKKYKIVNGVSYVTPAGIKATGSAMFGLSAVVNYAASIDTPENRSFVKAWAKKYEGDKPTNFEGETYVGMKAIFAAVKKADSVDPGKVAKAMESVSFDSVYGSTKMRPKDHALVVPNYIGVAKKDKGEPGGFTLDINTRVDAEKASPLGPGCGNK